MKVKWVPQAKKEMRLVAKYINKEFGKKAKDDFIQDVRDASRLIGATPNVGQRNRCWLIAPTCTEAT